VTKPPLAFAFLLGNVFSSYLEWIRLPMSARSVVFLKSQRRL